MKKLSFNEKWTFYKKGENKRQTVTIPPRCNDT